MVVPRKSKYVRSTKDSRGIPYDMDPFVFYEYKANLIAAQSEGIEWLLYRLFGPSNVRSVVFAIDPLARTRLSKVRIAPKNRSRDLTRLSVLDDVTRISDVKNVTTVVYHTSGRISQSTSASTTVTKEVVGGINSTARIFDTSASTRGVGSDFGEAEFSFFDLFSPSRYVTFQYKTVAKTDSNTVTLQTDTRQSWGRFMTVTKPNANSLRNASLSRATSELGRQKLRLVRMALPLSRSFSLGRSVAELKDLPRSILTLKGTLYNLRSVYNSMGNSSLRDLVFSLKNTSKSIPDEFLSFHFGWKQLFSDISSVLSKPERINKDINRLIDRNGKESSFTSSMKYSSSPSAPSSSVFSFGSSSYDDRITTGVTVTDRFNLRCTLQAKFDFPPAMELLFREDLFSRKLGVIPSPADLYDLVPWTWLVDWFTGFSQYLHIIEEMTTDPSLINFGFVSCLCESTYDVSREARTRISTSGYSVDGSTMQFTNDYVKSTYSASAVIKSYIREDVSSLASIRSAATGTNLTGFQQSIIGALLAQKAKH